MTSHKTRSNICDSPVQLTKGYYWEYLMNSFIAVRKRQQPNRKMGKGCEQTIHRKGNLKSSQEHANHNRCPFTSVRLSNTCMSDVSQDAVTCRQWNIAGEIKVTWEGNLAILTTDEHRHTKQQFHSTYPTWRNSNKQSQK